MVRKRIVGSISLSPYSLGCIVAFVLSPACLLRAQTAPPALGLFQNHADIGTVSHAGSAQYDAVHNGYSLTGSGENIWFTSDDFQFSWKQVSGDIALTADIAFPEKGGNPHRKAVLMIRQSLDADAVYADVALHGDGLTSLQFREARGSITHEIQSNLSAPHRLRIEKRGDVIYIFVAGQASEPLRPSGASITLPLEGSFYVGIGVCSHDKDAVEKAVFSNVALSAPAAGATPVLYSALETVAIASTDRRVVYSAPGHFEAPNWSHEAPTSSLIKKAPSCGCRWPAERPRLSTRTQSRIATTTTAFRRIALCSPSATSRSPTTSPASTSCPSTAAHRGASPKTLRPTGMGGRPMERRSPSSAGAMTISTSTPSPSPAVTRPA